MATVTGYTATRSKQIEDGTIVSGLVNPAGHLILTKHDESTVDAGLVLAPNLADASPTVKGILMLASGADALAGTDNTKAITAQALATKIPHPTYLMTNHSTGTANYVRLATLNGVNAATGAHLEFLISGLGDSTTARRASVLVNIVQKGDNVISARTWAWGFDDAVTPLALYTRQISTSVYEVWGLLAPNTQSSGLTVLSSDGSTINLDSYTTIAPSVLVAQTIARADSWNDLKDKPATFSPIIGAGATQAVAGNDGRLTVFGRKNRIINGNFRTNQRGYATGVFLPNNTYCFDRWKATIANTFLYFTSAPQGQTVTLSAGGSLAQVVERANILPATYTLTWTGGALGRVYNVGSTAPAYASSGLTVAIDGLADVVVEFTAVSVNQFLGKVQLEQGSIGTSYEQTLVEEEVAQCQRYYVQKLAPGVGNQLTSGLCASATSFSAIFPLPVRMRAVPILGYSTANSWEIRAAGTTPITALAMSGGSTVDLASIDCTSSALTAGQAGILRSATNANQWLAFYAEL